MTKKPILKVVQTARTGKRTGNNPPRPLSHAGRDLWDRITGEYSLEDSAGRELLLLACEALSRAEECREQITRDGVVLLTRNGYAKEHPALRAELASRAFVAKMLLRLGLDVEPLRSSPGRPPGVQWPSRDDEE